MSCWVHRWIQEDFSSSDESSDEGTPVKDLPGVTLRGRRTRHKNLEVSSDHGGGGGWLVALAGSLKWKKNSFDQILLQVIVDDLLPLRHCPHHLQPRGKPQLVRTDMERIDTMIFLIFLQCTIWVAEGPTADLIFDQRTDLSCLRTDQCWARRSRR